MRATNVVRQLMYMKGCSVVFTNNYPKCNTVKTYAWGKDDDLTEFLHRNLTNLGIPHEFRTGYGGGYIVRIPKERVTTFRTPEVPFKLRRVL